MNVPSVPRFPNYNFNLGNGTTESDNGNVIGITNNRVNARSQNFAYDPLNRITAGYSTGTNWGETYAIDAWGNLTNIGTYTGKNPLGNLNCAGGNTNNQLNTCFGYDSAGNMISNGLNTYTYDAENRIIAAGGQNYLYDGDGKRVAKCASSTCAVGTSGTFYWRNEAGNTLVESDVAGSFQNEYIFFNGKRIARRSLMGVEPVYYYYSDRLGSHSIVTDVSGVIQNESDYSPYGEEMIVADNISPQNYKFTGKERDSESALDYFGARHYASTMGRFMQPDPVGGHNEDPQTLNRYAYVRNNPLSLTDPTGLDFYLSCQTASNTCGKDAAGNLVQGTTTTTTNANGDTASTFNPTVVTSASLQDPNSGNTGTVNQNGVQITSNGQTSEGIFINGTPSADLAGSGKLEGFLFNVNGGDEKSGNLDYGNYVYTGSRNQSDVVKLLGERGGFQYGPEKLFGNYHHEGELNFRFSSGAHPNLFNYGPSLHMLVSQDPRATVPVGPGYKGNFHVDAKTGPQHSVCAETGVGCTN